MAARDRAIAPQFAVSQTLTQQLDMRQPLPLGAYVVRKPSAHARSAAWVALKVSRWCCLNLHTIEDAPRRFCTCTHCSGYSTPYSEAPACWKVTKGLPGSKAYVCARAWPKAFRCCCTAVSPNTYHQMFRNLWSGLYLARCSIHVLCECGMENI